MTGADAKVCARMTIGWIEEFIDDGKVVEANKEF